MNYLTQGERFVPDSRRVPDNRDDLIAALPLLARLDEESRRALARSARVRDVAAGATVFAQGDPADGLYVVVSGELRVIVASPSGDEATVALLREGEACGELGLIDGQPRSATVVASQRTKLLAVRREDFIEWLRPRPEAALALLATLSTRLRRMDETLADFAFLDLPQRLAKRLLELANASDDGTLIRVTQADLASMLGVSRESVNKELNALARAGTIELARGSIRVCDAAALARGARRRASAPEAVATLTPVGDSEPSPRAVVASRLAKAAPS
jgi:CRP-like cAMP-binding protein